LRTNHPHPDTLLSFDVQDYSLARFFRHGAAHYRSLPLPHHA
jgi:hypothetical protein